MSTCFGHFDCGLEQSNDAVVFTNLLQLQPLVLLLAWYRTEAKLPAVMSRVINTVLLILHGRQRWHPTLMLERLYYACSSHACLHGFIVSGGLVASITIRNSVALISKAHNIQYLEVPTLDVSVTNMDRQGAIISFKVLLQINWLSTISNSNIQYRIIRNPYCAEEYNFSECSCTHLENDKQFICGWEA